MEILKMHLIFNGAIMSMITWLLCVVLGGGGSRKDEELMMKHLKKDYEEVRESTEGLI